jgi:hypothetical protein
VPGWLIIVSDSDSSPVTARQQDSGSLAMSSSLSLSALQATATAVLDLKFFGVYGKALVVFCHAVRAATMGE